MDQRDPERPAPTGVERAALILAVGLVIAASILGVAVFAGLALRH